MKNNADQLKLIQQILSLPELKALLELQKTLEIRSSLLSQESGITTVDFSRLRTVVLGEDGEKYKFLNLLHLKKLIKVILEAVKKQEEATFPVLETLVVCSQEEEEVLLEEERQRFARQKEIAAEVFEREGDTFFFLGKVIQVFSDDTDLTKDQVSQLARVLLASENKSNILLLAQVCKKENESMTFEKFLAALSVIHH